MISLWCSDPVCLSSSIRTCGMLCGRLQRKAVHTSVMYAHFIRCCIVVALWIIGYFLFTRLLIIAQSKVHPPNIPHNNLKYLWRSCSGYRHLCLIDSVRFASPSVSIRQRCLYIRYSFSRGTLAITCNVHKTYLPVAEK